MSTHKERKKKKKTKTKTKRIGTEEGYDYIDNKV